MSVPRPKQVSYLRLLAPGWFLLLAVLNLIGFFIGVLSNRGFSSQQLLLFVFFSIPFFVRKKWAWLLCGTGYALFYGYHFTGISIAFARFLRGTHLPNPVLFFGVGFPLYIISLICAISLINRCLQFSGRNVTMKDPL